MFQESKAFDFLTQGAVETLRLTLERNDASAQCDVHASKRVP